MPRPLRRLAPLGAVLLAAALLPLMGVTTAGAAQGDALFRPAPAFRPGGADARVRPAHYTAVSVDLAGVRGALAAAPRSASRGVDPLVFAVPTPTGGSERFAVERTSVMQADLAAAHPDISTYAGTSLDNPGNTIALDVTPMGFHASVRDPGGRAWYVDPAFNRRGTSTALAYYGGAVPREVNTFVEREAPAIQQAVSDRSTGARTAPGGLVQQRIYRLALASDPSYAAHFGAANVTAEKVTLVNRVNQVYNDDFAINLRLVAGNDQLNFNTDAEATGANGPCGSHACYSTAQLQACDVGTLGRNRIVLGQIIGASNYDVGHLALGVNGGGIAYLGVVGWDYKAGGCTGLPDPEGDFFAIDYVAHEMGHQYAANHTFNGVYGACAGGNRHAATSVEPGSGSSVMAYAGICGSDDLQPHTDPYFSQRSIDEVSDYTGTPTAPVVEVQTVSLSGFDTNGEKITLHYPGSPAETLTRGTDYNRSGVEAAVHRLTGENVTIAGWDFDYYGHVTDTAPTGAGFQVVFAGDLSPDTSDSSFQDMDSLSVTSSSADGFVGETARGGAPGNTGNEVVATTNHAPVVTAPADATIPLRTPFTLEGSGTDADGDTLTYLWEQNDTGGSTGTALRSDDKRNGPLFRVFGRAANVSDAASHQSPSPGENHATTSPRRTFPDLRQVLAGNTNAKSGTCPTTKPLDCYSEFLPVAGYVGTAGTPLASAAMHFRLTARDGHADGGGTSYDDVTLRISQTAGPFLVTSQKSGDTVAGGQPMKVTWKVNGTRPLAGQVRILLSTDGGKTFPRVLASATDNDGAKRVSVPAVTTGHARIKIEAVGNYFFDTNDKGFPIG